MRPTSHAVYAVASQLCRLGHVRSGSYVATVHHCDVETRRPRYACIAPNGEVVDAEEEYDVMDRGAAIRRGVFRSNVRRDPDWSAFGAARALVGRIGVQAALVATGEEVAA